MLMLMQAQQVLSFVTGTSGHYAKSLQKLIDDNMINRQMTLQSLSLGAGSHSLSLALPLFHTLSLPLELSPCAAAGKYSGLPFFFVFRQCAAFQHGKPFWQAKSGLNPLLFYFFLIFLFFCLACASSAASASA